MDKLWGYAELVQLMIDAGADIDYKDFDGNTPLRLFFVNVQ